MAAVPPGLSAPLRGRTEFGSHRQLHLTRELASTACALDPPPPRQA
ncbi:hypothetical protein I5E68_12880 [Novosphingobium sp. YJ-S2-02]|uniref:Uncharacterized protein n=1 Tax=Novosphingobium aureum TaxID=2792964 RepID=A0A931HD35_9SPHN|nr:hypothetical protein [Novosphingobium aureum]